MIQLAIITFIVILIIALITLVLAPFALIAGMIYGGIKREKEKRAK